MKKLIETLKKLGATEEEAEKTAKVIYRLRQKMNKSGELNRIKEVFEKDPMLLLEGGHSMYEGFTLLFLSHQWEEK